jgi:iron complex outermembrane recepter protein
MRRDVSRTRARVAKEIAMRVTLGWIGAAWTLACLARVAEAQAPIAAPAEVRPPQVVKRVDAIYPPSAGRHADVVLNVTVDAEGHVAKAEVTESGGAEMDEAALEAVRQWTFHPATRGGLPVASRIRVPFHLAPPGPPPVEIAPPVPEAGGATAPVPPAKALSASTPSTPGGTGGAALTAGAAASSPSAARPAPSDVEDVNVYGHVQARSHGAADYQIQVGELKIIPRANASQALQLAPGFLLTNEGGEGHAEQVFLRGFDAHEGQDLEFTVDGVPINDAGNLHGNGYADTHFIIPELIQSIRVLEGPYAPQQGNFAVAGSADYHLGLDQRGLTMRYTVGSFNTQRLLLTWGPKEASSGTFVGAEYYTTDGFGINRQAQRGTAMAQYETPLGPHGLLRVTTQAYFTEFNSAGVVREDDYDSGRVGFYGAEDTNLVGNNSGRFSVAVTYETHLGSVEASNQLFAIERTMHLREDFTGFVEDVQQPMQSLHDQRGDEIDLHFDEQTVGARGSARYKGKLFGLPQEIELGYYARFDQTHSTQDRLAAATQQPYLIETDLTSTLGDIATYVDTNLKLLPWLAFRGGVRADLFFFDVLNNCANQGTVDFPLGPSSGQSETNYSCLSETTGGAYVEPFSRASTASGTILPKANLIFGPFDHFELIGSYGNGIRSVDPIYVSTGLSTPFVDVQSGDLGATYGRSWDKLSLSVKSVFFNTHVGQDLIFDQTVGRNTLSTGSSRTGWQSAVRAKGGFFDEAINATVVHAVFDDSGQCQPYCGLLVPYVPDVVIRNDTALFHDLFKLAGKNVRGSIGYGLSYVGPRPLPYGELSDIIFVSDASVRFNWNIFELGFIGQNIFNSKYKLGEYNYVSDFHSAPEPTLAPERVFTAGPPRMLFATLAATFGGN